MVILSLIGLISIMTTSKAKAVYENYVNNIPQPAAITTETQDIQKELETKVLEMVNSGHMAPTYYYVGQEGVPSWEANIFYETPEETIYTLSAVYPYLSPATQTLVKSYLDSEIRTYPPHSTGYYPPFSGKISDWTGARREYFTPDPNPAINIWPPPAVNVSVLYAIWLYSSNTNDWTYITNNYTALHNIYTTFKSGGNINSYPELAGVIGFARIAQHQNQTTDYNDALTFAEQGFSAGLNFDQFVATSSARFPFTTEPTVPTTYKASIFMFSRNPIALHFNKDIGLFLKDHAASSAATYSNNINQRLPLWWLTDVSMSQGENAYATPENSWTNFMLHAYVLEDNVAQLKNYLEAPNRKGDLLYLQKLVATIEAPTTSPTPTPTPVPCNLTSATWSTTTTTQGTSVGLNVSGDNNCLGKQVSIEVRRNGTLLDDIPANIQPNPVSFATNSAQLTTTWIAERNPLLPFTDPQYYFKAGTSGGNTIESNPRLLTVTQASGGTALQIASVTDNASSYPNSQVPKYEKYEINFQVNNSVAKNFQMPYDANPPAGVTPGQGITVNAQFSQDNFQTYSTQPAFYYQDFDYQVKSNQDWIYPTQNYSWKVRFTPDKEGVWQYRITAQDASGNTTSSTQTFTVVANPNNHGFIKVSQKDKRYFEFEDGTYFPGLGYNLPFSRISWDNPILENQANFQKMNQNGIQLIRNWFSEWSVFGSQVNPWHDFWDPNWTALKNNVAYPGSDVSMAVETYWNPCAFLGWLQKSPAVKSNTKYHVAIRYMIPQDFKPLDASKPYGLVAKLGSWPYNGTAGPNCYQSGVGTVVSSYAVSSPKDANGNPQWSILEGQFTTGNTDFLPFFYLAEENMDHSPITTAGQFAYIDRVDIQEDLGNSQYGVNILNKPWMSHLQYFDQRQSFAFDKVLDLAKQNNVYLKLVALEKNEYIQNNFDYNGNPTSAGSNDYYYGNWGAPTKIYWLQQAYWRYLQARWGYSTNIHSWELNNEGDPYSGRHYTLANNFAKYMHQFGPDSHMVTTSNWTQFPTTGFWGNASFQDLDYADVHQYITQGSAIDLRVDKPTDGAAVHIADPADFYDSAAETDKLSMQIGAKQPFGVNKPVMRGETGFVTGNSDGWNHGYFNNDTQAIWLHKYVWGQINPGGLIESYWYATEHIYSPQYTGTTFDHRNVYKPYYDFIKDIPLSNGNYQDVSATSSNTNIRAWGQKDTVNGRAHLWVDNKIHTWKNVVDGINIASQSGTVNFSGMPAGNYTVTWVDTYTGNNIQSGNITIDSSGNVNLSVTNLDTDVAVKLERQGTPNPTPTPVPCTLTSASWSTQTTTQGNNVNLSVSGNNCAGQAVSFEVRRYGSTPLDDILANVQPQTQTFATNSAQLSTTWTAEYTPLQVLGISLGNPQYYFKATVSGGNTIESNPRLLTVTQSSGGISATDWPMYMKDPTHSGSTSSIFNPVWGTVNCASTVNGLGITPCIQARWKKGFNEWPNGMSQPVVVGNTVFQANMDGKLYAYDTETGNEKWTFDAGSAIAVTPAIFNNRIYFGDFSGKIYALNIADKSLVAGFPIQTGGAIYSSPVVIQEGSTIKVFIGSNDGKLYGINGENGQLLFTPFDTGSYIYSNPAYYNGKIFFASENMYAYALNSSTGAEVWKHKLDGESNRGNHPVIVTASNTVLFHSIPRFGDTDMGLKDMFWNSIWNNPTSPSQYITTSLKDTLTTYQNQVLVNPGTKSMYLFNTDNGVEVNNFTVKDTTSSAALQMIPLNLWYMNGQNMPMVMNQKDLVFATLQGYVKLDTTTGEFTYISNYHPVRGDEFMGGIISEGWLYGGFIANIARMKVDGSTTLTDPSDTNTRQQLHGCKDCGPIGTGQGILDGYTPLDQALSPNHWQGYTGDGATSIGNFFIVAGGHAYWSSNGWFYAF